ncbi:hypothetical protein C0J52_25227, partial [Blattella germanica]
VKLCATSILRKLLILNYIGLYLTSLLNKTVLVFRSIPAYDSSIHISGHDLFLLTHNALELSVYVAYISLNVPKVDKAHYFTQGLT